MTRFSEKLDGLLQTVDRVLGADFTDIAAAIRTGEGRPTIAIGSGGSAITAQYFARCRETLFGGPTEVVTAAEFVLGNRDLASSDVWLFSAGADNPDSVACVLAARARSAGRIFIVTRNPAGAAASGAAGLAARVLTVPVTEMKDGFLATHSLLASVLALLLASDKACADPVGEPLTLGVRPLLAAILSATARASWAEKLASLRRDDLLLLICDPQLKTVGELIETSAWEASLCAVQRTDMRNFAHGRHSWLHHRAAQTIVLGLVGHDTQEMWQAIASRLPPAARQIGFALGDTGRLANAIGIVEALTIVEAMGGAVDIDPGRPGIDDFGRALYHDNRLLALSRRLASSTRQKRAALLARDDGSAAGSICTAAAEWRTRLLDSPVGAIILDYDGTIISDEERYGAPRAQICDELIRLAGLGVRLGIATGRGGSGGKALRGALPAELHDAIIIGYYNGAYVQTLSVNIEANPAPKDDALAETFAWLQAHPELFSNGVGGRFSNVQISIKLDDLADCTALPAALQACPAIARGAVKYALSGHSVDFVTAATSKRSVFDRLRRDVAADAAILCIGDSGARGGNDNELLSHPHGISVGTVCGRSDGCWSLFGKELTGPEALLKILQAMKPDVQGRVVIEEAMLGLDKSAQ